MLIIIQLEKVDFGGRVMKKYVVLALLVSVGNVASVRSIDDEPIDDTLPIEEPKEVLNPVRQQLGGDQSGGNPSKGSVIQQGPETGPESFVAPDPQGSVIIEKPTIQIPRPNPTPILESSTLPAELKQALNRLTTASDNAFDNLVKSDLKSGVVAKMKNLFKRMSNYFKGTSNTKEFIRSTNQATDLIVGRMNNLLAESLSNQVFGITPVTDVITGEMEDLKKLIIIESSYLQVIKARLESATLSAESQTSLRQVYTSLKTSIDQAVEQVALIQELAKQPGFGIKILLVDPSNPIAALKTLGIQDASLAVRNGMLATVKVIRSQFTPLQIKSVASDILLRYKSIQSGKLSSALGRGDDVQGLTERSIVVKVANPVIKKIMDEAARMDVVDLMLSRGAMKDNDDLYTQLKREIFDQAIAYKRTYLSTVDAFSVSDPTLIDNWVTMLRQGNNLFIEPKQSESITLAANLTRLSQVMKTFNKAFDTAWQANSLISKQSSNAFNRSYNQLLSLSSADQQVVQLSLQDEQSSILEQLQKYPDDTNLAKQREYIQLRIEALK